MEVVFHMTPNSTGDKRQWDKFHLLADYLVKRHNAIITIVGARGDRKYIRGVIDQMQPETRKNVGNLVGTLRDLTYLLKNCDLLVCVNSFVMHLGVCLGVKMFAIVGATEPHIVLPPGIPHFYAEYAHNIPLCRVIEGIG